MTERYPVIDATPDGDDLVVELPVLSTRWLERLLLRLGPTAEVLDPPELRDVGATAAARLWPATADGAAPARPSWCRRGAGRAARGR